MSEQEPPSEQDLHAYLDGALEPLEATRIAAYLAQHPETAALLEAYRAQNAGFHALYDNILDEPVPDSMLALLRRRHSAVLWRRAASAAALLALVMVSAGTGWWFSELSHGRETEGPAALVVEAQRAHRLFAGDDRGVGEAVAQRNANLAQSLSERIGAPVMLPEVERAGLSLQGVRLMPTPAGTAAVLVYRDGAGRSVSLFIAPIAAADAPARADSSDDVTTFYRVANGLGYALTLPRADAIPAVKVAFGMQTGP